MSIRGARIRGDLTAEVGEVILEPTPAVKLKKLYNTFFGKVSLSI